MVKDKASQTSLDDLANMVARGFESVEKRMVTKDEFNTRIDSVEKRLGKVEFRVDEVYDILKHFEESDILNLQKRVQILEKAVRLLASQLQK